VCGGRGGRERERERSEREKKCMYSLYMSVVFVFHKLCQNNIVDLLIRLDNYAKILKTINLFYWAIDSKKYK
jgi:hypothetical protein